MHVVWFSAILLKNPYRFSIYFVLFGFGTHTIFVFSDVLMVGDDIRDDVLGAQDAGFQVNLR